MKNRYLLAIAIIPFIVGCGNTQKFSNSSAYSTINSEEIDENFADFHTDVQRAYLHDDYRTILNYGIGQEEQSRPKPITVNTGNANLLEYSTHQDFRDSTTVMVSGSYDFINVYMATTYYYRYAVMNSELSTATIHSFKTADYGPRNLYVDGVTNVRDCGGRIASDDTRIAQGKLIRGARWNESYTKDGVLIEEITKEGKETIKNDLKIKTEIDLRTNSDNEVGSLTKSLVDGVTYVNIPFANTTGDYMTGNKSDICMLFKVFANAGAYPIYFHCSIGTDRTGLVSYIIENLFGVSDDEIYKDYLFSNLASIGSKRTPSVMEKYDATLAKYGMQTKQENTIEYLKDCGLNDSDIFSIKMNLSE